MIFTVLGLGSNRSLKKSLLPNCFDSAIKDCENSTETEKKLPAESLSRDSDSDLLNSVEILKKACESLFLIFSNCAISSVYKTRPMYFENQNYFYNMIFCGFADDNMSAKTLLNKIHTIEEAFGRNRSEEIKNGPRTLDIDIELFGNNKIDNDELHIPHPKIHERAFVLVPLIEVCDKFADFPNKEYFSSALKRLNPNRLDIEKVISASDFLTYDRATRF